jgi:TonB-linked SusC/RagA family outer membrane protein
MEEKHLPKRKDFTKIAGLSLALILAISAFSFTRAQTVTGVVSASDTKETLPGATVMVKGTTIGTVTNIDGKYSITVIKENAVLVYSFVGYITQEVAVGKQAVIDVTLAPSKTNLDEFVVIGYGTVRKSDLSGSVGSIKGDDITKITALNPVQSLQGQVSGVQVTSTSGTPGDNPVVRIRGTGTIYGASPIYVVDGNILNDISFINSSDIQSMEVLKDASATAMYGSRGANGVIMVTTKSGNATQEKTVFNFNAELGIQKLAKKIDLLNGHNYAVIANQIKPGTYNNVDAVPNTDWQDLIFHTAPIYDVQLSASGSSKKVQYFISGSYFKQGGIIDKSSYQRVTLKFNNTYSLTKYIQLGTNINLAPYSQQIAPDVTYQAYRALPTIEPYYSDGTFASVPGVGNPLASLEYSNNYRKGIRGVGNVYASVNFLKSFILKSSYGIDAGYDKAENFTPKFAVLDPDGTSSQQNNPFSDLSKSWSDNYNWLWETTLSYQQTFGKHNIDAVAGYTMQDAKSEYMNTEGKNLIRDGRDFWYILPSYIYDPTQNINVINSFNNGVGEYWSMISYLIRVNYTFNQRYILTATFRRDGSSKFSEKNRYGNFPSVALGWNISREKFMQPVKFISKLKIRASWGMVGNDKIPYLAQFSTVENMTTVFGVTPAPVSGASYSINGNSELKWETTTQFDVGLETGFFDDRLTAEFDYYRRVTDDILIPLTTSGYLGNGPGAKVLFNAGSVLNRGFEFNLGWRDKIGIVTYNVGAVGSTLHNEMLTIGGVSGSDTQLSGGNLANGDHVTRTIVGIPIGSFYGYQTDGLFQSQAELDAYPHLKNAVPGDLRFVDLNGDGIIDDKDRTNIGSPIPTFILGVNLGLEVVGIDFSVSLQGQWGNKIYNAKNEVRPSAYNFEQSVMDRWTGPGTSNSEPIPSLGGNNYLPSDYFVQDGSYIRIRNVMLGYTLPKKWSTRIAMQKLRLYVKADNLFTFAKYTGYTPEVASEAPLNNGIDFGTYPVTSVYSVGLNLTF